VPTLLTEDGEHQVLQAGAFPTEHEAQKVLDTWRTEGLSQPAALNCITCFETAEDWEADR
jgi:hypothetical protein